MNKFPNNHKFRIRWNELWNIYDTIVRYKLSSKGFGPIEWAGPDGYFSILKFSLAEQDVKLTDDQWKKFDDDFEEWCNTIDGRTSTSWEDQQNYIEDYIIKLKII